MFRFLFINRLKSFYRISKREDCEMIMLIGLPGCGKTTWVIISFKVLKFEFEILTHKVYNDPRIKREFFLGQQVCIGAS